jgi:hypothetical protein
MTGWLVGLVLYLCAAIASLVPTIRVAISGVELNPGGPAFNESPHFSAEAKKQLAQNYDRMRGTLGFWKQQAKKFECLHLYCMIWLILLSAAIPTLTVAIPSDDIAARYLLTATALHISIITGIHKFFKVEVNFKAYRHGESEFYDNYRRMLDTPLNFGKTEDEQLAQYFSEVSLIRKQVRNAETDTYAGLEELRQAQVVAPAASPPAQKS